jgi:hypothetical protein
MDNNPSGYKDQGLEQDVHLKKTATFFRGMLNKAVKNTKNIIKGKKTIINTYKF